VRDSFYVGVIASESKLAIFSSNQSEFEVMTESCYDFVSKPFPYREQAEAYAGQILSYLAFQGWSMS